MAEKRPQDGSGDDIPAKIARISVDDDSKLKNFLDWCNENNLVLNEKVRVCREGSCAQLGMVAVEDIEEGECLFEVPRECLLTPDNSSINKILADENAVIFSESGWVSLLLAILRERINPNSKWKAYLEIVPDFKELHQPMFWSTEDMETNLQGTGIPSAVHTDLANMEKEFKKIVVPFMKLHPRAFTEECFDFELYKKLCAFVMAYSFTEPPPEKTQAEGEGCCDEGDGCCDEDEDEDVAVNLPMMVPMADMLNHVAKNNAKLEFRQDALRMVAIKNITKGSEVYNTYGELPNWQLMQMYGFSEQHPHNHNDTVEIGMPLLLEAVLEMGAAEDVADDKWSCMKDMGLVSAEGMFVIGEDGVLSEEEMHSCLKVFAMSPEEFTAFKENEGWIEEEDDGQSLTLEGITKLPESWKKIIQKMVEARLIHYNDTLEQEEELLNGEAFTQLTYRQKHACYVRHAQLKLLHRLLDATK